MKTLPEIRDMIATAQAGDADRILDICQEIVSNLERVEREARAARRRADDAALGPAMIGRADERFPLQQRVVAMHVFATALEALKQKDDGGRSD